MLCPSGMLWRIHIDTDAMNKEIGVAGIGCDQCNLIYPRYDGKRNVRRRNRLELIHLIGQCPAQYVDVETISFPEGIQIRKQFSPKGSGTANQNGVGSLSANGKRASGQKTGSSLERCSFRTEKHRERLPNGGKLQHRNNRIHIRQDIASNGCPVSCQGQIVCCGGMVCFFRMQPYPWIRHKPGRCWQWLPDSCGCSTPSMWVQKPKPSR